MGTCPYSTDRRNLEILAMDFFPLSHQLFLFLRLSGRGILLKFLPPGIFAVMLAPLLPSSQNLHKAPGSHLQQCHGLQSSRCRSISAHYLATGQSSVGFAQHFAVLRSFPRTWYPRLWPHSFLGFREIFSTFLWFSLIRFGQASDCHSPFVPVRSSDWISFLLLSAHLYSGSFAASWSVWLTESATVWCPFSSGVEPVSITRGKQSSCPLCSYLHMAIHISQFSSLLALYVPQHYSMAQNDVSLDSGWHERLGRWAKPDKLGTLTPKHMRTLPHVHTCTVKPSATCIILHPCYRIVFRANQFFTLPFWLHSENLVCIVLHIGLPRDDGQPKLGIIRTVFLVKLSLNVFTITVWHQPSLEFSVTKCPRPGPTVFGSRLDLF